MTAPNSLQAAEERERLLLKVIGRVSAREGDRAKVQISEAEFNALRVLQFKTPLVRRNDGVVFSIRRLMHFEPRGGQREWHAEFYFLRP